MSWLGFPYLSQLSRPFFLVGILDEVGERVVEFQHRLAHDPRFRALSHAPVHADGGAKLAGRPAKVRRGNGEQARLAPGHVHLAVARPLDARAAAVVVAKVALANVQIDQPGSEPEADAHRARDDRLIRIGERHPLHDHLKQKYVISFRRHCPTVNGCNNAAD